MKTKQKNKLSSFKAKRAEFTTDEWIDLLIRSIGFNPEFLSKRKKMLQLVRLIPYCERNYNFIELGPKGTGKTHIYTDFSPHGTLISGSEVSAAKLFVNNSRKHDIGLVGYWDNIAFDEFAGKKKKIDDAFVDIMQNYMAMKKCVFCGNDFEKLSKEHIIPNCICGRLKSYDVLCETCNSELGDNIDTALDGVYNQIINMFAIPRDEGESQPAITVDENTGKLYQYLHDGSYELAEPTTKFETNENGAIAIKIEAKV